MQFRLKIIIIIIIIIFFFQRTAVAVVFFQVFLQINTIILEYLSFYTLQLLNKKNLRVICFVFGMVMLGFDLGVDKLFLIYKNNKESPHKVSTTQRLM